MSDLQELYQQVILDHNAHPRNFGPLRNANFSAQGYNPLCGDKIQVQLRVEDDTISEIHFEGSGCAISKAAASIMTTLVKGKTNTEALKLFDNFHDLLTSTENTSECRAELAVFAGVKEFPSRIKCATLAWHAMREALRGGEIVSTE